MTEVEAKELLIDEDTFLTCGVHIGTKQKSKDMEPYVYKVRDDGLRILTLFKCIALLIFVPNDMQKPTVWREDMK